MRTRAERVRGTASSVLFGDDTGFTLFGPAGVDPEMLDDAAATFDDWISESAPPGIWGGARLGGVAGWDQADASPSCEHGEYLHLLDHEGGQFLDGALHVFACRAGTCPLRFVAEF